jgi:hypothetical protein
MVAQSVPDASQTGIEDQYEEEDEETRIRRWEGGVMIDWVE